MFSKGTFNRYLFEIESIHKRMIDIYSRLADTTTDPAVKEPIRAFLDELDTETKTLADIQVLLKNE